MAGRIDPELKSFLKKHKRWHQFWKARSALILGGVRPDVAHARALEWVGYRGIGNALILVDCSGEIPLVDPNQPLDELPEIKSDAKIAAELSERAWKRLLSAAGDSEAPELENIRWVASNLGREPEKIVKTTIPSVAAVNWLKFLKDSPVSQAKFWEVSYPKLLPSKTDMLKDDKLVDDGRVLECIERMMEAEQPE